MVIQLAPLPPKEEDEEEARQPFIRQRLNQDYEHNLMVHMSIETTIDEVKAEIIAAREEESPPPQKKKLQQNTPPCKNNTILRKNETTKPPHMP